MSRTISQVPWSKLPSCKLPNNTVIPHFPRKDFSEVINAVQDYTTFYSSTILKYAEYDSRMYRPIINSEDKQIWDSKADEKLAPISSRQLQGLQLYLSLEAFSFFEMDTVQLFLSSKN